MEKWCEREACTAQNIGAKPKTAYASLCSANTLNVNRFCNAQIHKHNVDTKAIKKATLYTLNTNTHE